MRKPHQPKFTGDPGGFAEAKTRLPSNFRASKSLQNARMQTKLLCQSGVDEGRKDEGKKDDA